MPPEIPDIAIMTFLSGKGIITIAPMRSSKSQAAIDGAITGAYGPVIGGIGHITRNQRSAAAQAEWTSWKQWALSHQDWAKWYSQEWPSLQKEIEAKDLLRKQATERHLRQVQPIAIGATALAILAFSVVIYALVPMASRQKPNESNGEIHYRTYMQ